jgi:hypothetical protein
MTSNISENELHALDAKMGLKNQNNLLFLGRCPAHPLNKQFQNIKLAIFLGNCISELQPLDLGIIHSSKLNYQKNLIQKAGVKVLMIMNSFRKTGLCLENCIVILQETPKTSTSIMDANWEQLNSGSTFSNFVEVDAGVLTCEQQTTDNVLDQHGNHVNEGGTVSEEEDGDEEILYLHIYK